MKKSEMIERLQKLESDAWDELAETRRIWMDEYDNERDLGKNSCVAQIRTVWGAFYAALKELDIPSTHSEEASDKFLEVYRYYRDKAQQTA